MIKIFHDNDLIQFMRMNFERWFFFFEIFDFIPRKIYP